MKDLMGKSMKDLFFLFSDEHIPTWWTQHPSTVPLLTGWFSGPKAKLSSGNSNATILNDALESLANIFKREKRILRKNLDSWKVVNWSKDEFTLGSYSFQTVNSKTNCIKAGKAEKDTLFFAGEHLGQPSGTVEGAIASGMKAAQQIIGRKKE
jgi:monoamine oxidase